MESILGQLEFHDLVLAKRICRYWQQVIESSPKLQQALFLAPVPQPAIQMLRPINFVCNTRCGIFDGWRTNAMYRARFALDREAAGPLSNRHMQHWYVESGRMGDDRLLVNPILITTLAWRFGLNEPQGYLVLRPSQLTNAVVRPEASWRKMLISQPPIREFNVDSGT